MSLTTPILDRPIFEELQHVEAALNYLIPMAEKPVNYTYEPPPGVPPHNGAYQAHRLSIYNARAIAADLSLDREGFARTTHHSAVRNFFPQIQWHEALLIKCFDSAEDGRARFAAHTAFDDPTSPPDAPPRESIELRTLVFYTA